MAVAKRPFVAATGSQPTSATLALVSELTKSGPFVDRRVRTVGWLLAVDAMSSLALVEHDGHGVLVDLKTALNRDLEGVPLLKSLLVLFGDLQRVPSADREMLEPQVQRPMPTIDTSLILRATHLVIDNSLNIDAWVGSVAAIRLQD